MDSYGFFFYSEEIKPFKSSDERVIKIPAAIYGVGERLIHTHTQKLTHRRRVRNEFSLNQQQSNGILADKCFSSRTKSPFCANNNIFRWKENGKMND